MLEHHEKAPYCETRPLYRASKKPTSVKVYTINLESQYLIIQNVPDINLGQELQNLLKPYGKISGFKQLTDYPSEQFSTAFSIKFQNFHQSKLVKHKFDEYSFYGSLLHICYAPEYESVEETIAKFNMHLNDVINRTSDYNKYKDK